MVFFCLCGLLLFYFLVCLFLLRTVSKEQPFERRLHRHR